MNIPKEIEEKIRELSTEYFPNSKIVNQKTVKALTQFYEFLMEPPVKITEPVREILKEIACMHHREAGTDWCTKMVDRINSL